MGFRVTLRYPDGAEIGQPSDVEVDALPPVDSELRILSQPWVVHQISLSVRGDGRGLYTVILREETPKPQPARLKQGQVRRQPPP